jgi:hypothetical protein
MTVGCPTLYHNCIACALALHAATSLPVETRSDNLLFIQADVSRDFKHFHPNFRDVDPSLAIASSLFMAFAFRKPPAPAAPQAADVPSTVPDTAPTGTEDIQQQQLPHQEPPTEPRKRAAPTAPTTKRPTVRRRGGKAVREETADPLPDG